MLDGTQLSIFVTAVLFLVFFPGPNTLYIVARSLEQGRRAGLISSLGVQVATLLHALAASLGLSALLLQSALAFSLVKYAGAAYLIYLGVLTLLNHQEHQPAKTPRSQPNQGSLAKAFYQGIIVNLLNPKTVLFFFAFLPQFVDPTRGSTLTQTLLLSAVLVLLGTVSDLVYVLFAGGLRGLLQGKRVRRVQRYVSGSIYLGLGVLAAFSGSDVEP